MATKMKRNMMTGRTVKRVLTQFLPFYLFSLLLFTACGDDEDELNINDVIVGTWVLDKTQADGKGYVIESDQQYDLMVDRIELKADQTFEFVVDEFESHTGTYEAGHDYLRFDYADESDPLLWQLLSFDEQTLNAKYRETEHDITVTVWLRKR